MWYVLHGAVRRCFGREKMGGKRGAVVLVGGLHGDGDGKGWVGRIDGCRYSENVSSHIWVVLNLVDACCNTLTAYVSFTVPPQRGHLSSDFSKSAVFCMRVHFNSLL